MSLDSGDEISQIEVCSNFHSEILAEETKGSCGTNQKQNFQAELQLSLDMQKRSPEDKPCHTDSEDAASVDMACSEDGDGDSAGQDSSSNVQVYHSQFSMCHQVSHFNVVTHQTFLGIPYVLSSTQSPETDHSLSAYAQSVEGDKAESPLSWGKKDFSQPYSKEK